jgi:LPS export ABC transporter protein LptC
VSARSACAAAALICLILPLTACRNSGQQEAGPQPFVVRELNLRQDDAEGRPLWELSSPETRYDLSRRLAQARQLRGVLYREGKPLYRLTASNAVVINDGEVVLLEGPTRLVHLDPNRPAVITAERLRWYPAQERMDIDRAPRATQGDLELTATLARFQIKEDRLELRGRPLLVQRGPEPVRLDLGAVDWFPATGQLRARGPVQGTRRLSGGGQQELSAPALTGNTRTQIIDLQAPVSLRDDSRDALLTAQATRLDLSRRRASSALPFTGRYGGSDLTGGAFALDGAGSTVLVSDGCRLEQPGDSLSASRCFWDWTSGRVAASGDVELRRQANGLRTRAARLEGAIGKNGRIAFLNPGGRVITELKLPATPAAPRSGRDGDKGGVRESRPPAFQL